MKSLALGMDPEPEPEPLLRVATLGPERTASTLVTHPKVRVRQPNVSWPELRDARYILRHMTMFARLGISGTQ